VWTSTTKRKTIYNKAARRRQLNLKGYWTIQCNRMLKYNIMNSSGHFPSSCLLRMISRTVMVVVKHRAVLISSYSTVCTVAPVHWRGRCWLQLRCQWASRITVAVIHTVLFPGQQSPEWMPSVPTWEAAMPQLECQRFALLELSEMSKRWVQKESRITALVPCNSTGKEVFLSVDVWFMGKEPSVPIGEESGYTAWEFNCDPLDIKPIA
jgi:hypothetical protein